MTTDIVQNKHILRKKNGTSGEFYDLFDSFHDDLPEDRNTDYTSGEVIDLLRAAHGMLKEAEARIADQTNRIMELENLLTADELTGLHNRRGFFEALEREIDRTNRDQEEGGLLIMVDLDKFKAINDTYGHLAGDACLKKVGEFLKNEIRHMDVAARLGGDEFILLFPKANAEKAKKRAKDMAARFNTLSITWDGHTLPIRASFGLKDYGPNEDIIELIDHADRKLYEDKKSREEARQSA